MKNTPENADYHAIDAGSPPLITMLWGLRLVVRQLIWGKMDS